MRSSSSPGECFSLSPTVLFAVDGSRVMVVAMDTRNMPRLGDLTKLQVNDVFSLEYAKWLSCLGETTIASSASELYLMRYPDGLGASIVKKAIVPPGTNDRRAWAGAIVAPKPFVDAFVAIARSASLLGRIPGLRSIPFGVKVPIQTGDAGYVWVAQGAPKPVSKLAFSATASRCSRRSVSASSSCRAS